VNAVPDYLQDEIRQREQALAAARQAGNKRVELEAINQLSWSYYRLENHERLQTLYQEAVVLTRELGDRKAEATYLNKLGRLLNEGDPQRAEALFEQALAAARESGNLSRQAENLAEIAGLKRKSGTYQDAIRLLEQSLALYQAVNKDEWKVSDIFYQIGVVYRDIEDIPQAAHYFEEAARNISGKESPFHYLDHMVYLNSLGSLYGGQNDKEKALQYQAKALEVARNSGKPGLIEIALHYLGMAYIEFQEHDRAVQLYEEALAEARASGDPHGENLFLSELGKVYKSKQQYPEALDYYQQVLSLARERENWDDEMAALRDIASVYSDMSQFEDAFRILNEVMALSREHSDQQWETLLLRSFGEACEAQGDYPAALDYFERTLTLAKTVMDRLYVSSITERIEAVRQKLAEAGGDK
jgi:tetratricopeptide (TPR) repeat protein